MKSVSIIPCNNGLGHVKRCCLLYDELVKLGINVTIFGNADRISSFVASRGQNVMPSVHNFEGLPSGQDYLKHGLDSFNDIFQTLGELLKDTLVISDNYFEPFLNGANGFLLANFLWSDLDGELLGYDVVKKVNDVKCTILTTIFAKNYLQDAVKINLFGMLTEQSPALGYTLVCKGFGDWHDGFEEQLESFLEKRLNNNHEGETTLYIDKNIIFRESFWNYNVRILEQGITSDIIAGADCIIGRPSMGMVTDSLAYKVPFLPVYALRDDESRHNASVLSKLYQKNGIDPHHNFSIMRDKMRNVNFGLGGEKQLAKRVYRVLTS